MKKYFDEYYKGGRPYFKLIPSGVLKNFLASHPGNGKFALDIGCGNGRNSVAIINEGYKCLSLDVSVEAFKSLINNIERNPQFLYPVLGDGINLPLKGKSVSLIFCGTVLSCIPNVIVINVFQECYRILKSRGYLVFTDFSINDPGHNKKNLPDQIASECSEGVQTYFSVSELKKALREFKLLRIWELEKTDLSHGPPHKHNLIRFIAQKV